MDKANELQGNWPKLNSSTVYEQFSFKRTNSCVMVNKNGMFLESKNFYFEELLAEK